MSTSFVSCFRRNQNRRVSRERHPLYVQAEGFNQIYSFFSLLNPFFPWNSLFRFYFTFLSHTFLWLFFADFRNSEILSHWEWCKIIFTVLFIGFTDKSKSGTVNLFWQILLLFYFTIIAFHTVPFYYFVTSIILSFC